MAAKSYITNYIWKAANLIIEGRPQVVHRCTRAGVPNLGYMYPQGYICLSEGVHLRLAKIRKIYLHIYFQIFIHISLSIMIKYHYMLIVKYV